ncbi:MAG: S8 family serine peptidase, partial [Candidatus Kapaibacterium sp.]
SKTPLPTPDVSVVSIRVLPTTDPNDIDLYESIDIIEKAVPARQDVKWWNLSFGPEGPVLDDEISRFTYALDLLAVNYRVAFCVAVGNDGDSEDDLARRIQAPSDIVNGFGVGAFTLKEGVTVHAPYSCKGPGREPGKIKPDLVAFGGCEDFPMHLVSLEPGKKILAHGTSFPSPVVTARGAITTDRFDRGSTLLSRVLLVHSAKHPDGSPDDFLGHGIVPEIDDILFCGQNHVTIVSQNTISDKQYARIPIFIPKKLRDYSKAKISWTIGVLSPIDSRNPSDYTSCCIEDWLYPHSERYTFRPPKGVKGSPVNLLLSEQRVEELLNEGWTKSEHPVSATSKYAIPERDLRSDSYKWETIVKKFAGKLEDSLHDPYLIVHADPRNGWHGLVDFAVAITVSLPNYEGDLDLYALIRRQWSELIPIRLRTQAELRVQI